MTDMPEELIIYALSIMAGGIGMVGLFWIGRFIYYRLPSKTGCDDYSK